MIDKITDIHKFFLNPRKNGEPMTRSISLNLTMFFIFLGGLNQAYAIKSVQFSSISAVSVLSIEGTRLRNPQINVIGKSLTGANLPLIFTYNSETAKNCLLLANEAVSTKKKMIINVSDTPHNDEYKVFGCATGDGPLPIPIF